LGGLWAFFISSIKTVGAPGLGGLWALESSMKIVCATDGRFVGVRVSMAYARNKTTFILTFFLVLCMQIVGVTGSQNCRSHSFLGKLFFGSIDTRLYPLLVE